MPLANRVDPFGEIHADPARGMLMGNRGGRLHDPATRELGTRRWATRRWITCRLDFKGRRRQVMGKGYTELFFLDEVTALAAGHRPCFECRRAEGRAFAAALGRALGADAIDGLLHGERLGSQERTRVDTEGLPDGAMLAIEGEAYALHDGRLLEWRFTGYRVARIKLPGQAVLLTPPATVAALASGYRPMWHASAG